MRYQPRSAKPAKTSGAARAAFVEAIGTRSAHLAELPQAKRSDTGLMFTIGLFLGAAYLVFLALWFWATRIRPRPTRSGRGGIDTGKRIE
jgi:hypothetical protein